MSAEMEITKRLRSIWVMSFGVAKAVLDTAHATGRDYDQCHLAISRLITLHEGEMVWRAVLAAIEILHEMPGASEATRPIELYGQAVSTDPEIGAQVEKIAKLIHAEVTRESLLS